MIDISIHALYERVRPRHFATSYSLDKFQSTHSMKECDWTTTDKKFDQFAFQSTHSMKECDENNLVFLSAIDNFNPRTLWKSATGDLTELADSIRISIHALYERVRLLAERKEPIKLKFQSTHSMKECDVTSSYINIITKNFNPRTLWKSATAFES